MTRGGVMEYPQRITAWLRRRRKRLALRGALKRTGSAAILSTFCPRRQCASNKQGRKMQATSR